MNERPVEESEITNLSSCFVVDRLCFISLFMRTRQGDQFTSGFVKVNPNSKIPALVDNGASDGEVRGKEEEAVTVLRIVGHLGRFYSLHVLE